MTTEERLRDAARELRKNGKDSLSNGTWISELMERAADELDQLTLMVGDLARSGDAKA